MSYVGIWEENILNRGVVMAETLWPDVLEDRHKVSEEKHKISV